MYIIWLTKIFYLLSKNKNNFFIFYINIIEPHFYNPVGWDQDISMQRGTVPTKKWPPVFPYLYLPFLTHMQAAPVYIFESHANWIYAYLFFFLFFFVILAQTGPMSIKTTILGKFEC